MIARLPSCSGKDGYPLLDRKPAKPKAKADIEAINVKLFCPIYQTQQKFTIDLTRNAKNQAKTLIKNK
jgi:hypothetical protein